ncbi:sensor histidine kinase [Muriicola sp. Z0-33]|uniref:sensor histidine kinase n=1 Tax=Muriicola sp. Z0-33 TaxID=2816957 RepID=UPI00223740B9|nr:sensor histidine kinase [Muriicola sp. Z0-33]MCW5515750.1 histidine kinase [Muriicola sp. Z0-33]
MDQSFTFSGSKTKEIVFQVLLHIVLFLFFSFDRNEPQIQQYKIVAFINYAIGAFIINYILLPTFFYKKEYLRFFLSVAVIVTIIIVVEEFVLERIYYPDSRGKYFPGVIYSLLDVMPVIMILAGFKFAWDASTKQREVEELRSYAQQSELQFLKSQINPHFLFNNLNNLYSYALAQSPKTPSIILELSSLLRYMLYDCKEDFVALAKEIEHLKNFAKLSELQIEERGKVNFRAQGINLDYSIAPLILTVFIENAFKHSTASQSSDIIIDIDINVSDDGLLEFECKNSFLSLGNTESLDKGIGLQNVRKRLQILYPNAHELLINEGEGLYTVVLRMQLKKKQE